MKTVAIQNEDYLTKPPPPKPKRSLTNYDPESIKAHLCNYKSPSHSRQSSAELNNHLVMASFDLAEREASKIEMISSAQRKLSEASVIFPVKPRERRNSFREAVEKTDTKSYEPIWFKENIYENVQRASNSRKISAELTSVSLVSEVNKGLNKQNSNSSLTSSLSGHSLTNGKGPPPPYVEPPHPIRQVGVAQQQTRVPTSMATYANVQFRKKGWCFLLFFGDFWLVL